MPDNLARLRILLAVLAALGLACQPSEPSPPNVVVILMDTLRPDHLGFHGYEREHAPFLAELAARSVVFERAFSTSSWTAPSTSSLFTSLYPHQHGVVEGFVVHQNRAKRNRSQDSLALNRLPAEVETLPEAFRAAGYATFGLAANINIGDEIGFDRGFDRFERDPEASAEFFLERVTRWQDEIRGEKPFFLYLHLNDVHAPYHMRHPYYEKHANPAEDRRARYLSELAYADAHLRKIYEQLELGTDSIIVALSDHGEEFGEHGGLEHPATLHVELNRVLMLIHAPARLAPRRVTLNVSLIDVLPTLLELVGAPQAREGTPGQGVSLVPILRPSEATDALRQQLRERILFAHRLDRDAALWAATRQHWKLIETPGRPYQLYDQRDDPTESRDLYPTGAETARPLIEALEQFKRLAPATRSDRVEVQLDRELEQQLRSLGYAD